jgi:hypothetical protein
MLLLLLTIALNLPLLAAMALAARALLDLQKRKPTAFLEQAPVSSGSENRYIPTGLWHVQRLASTYCAPLSDNERWAWL